MCKYCFIHYLQIDENKKFKNNKNLQFKKPNQKQL